MIYAVAVASFTVVVALPVVIIEALGRVDAW